MSQSSGSHSKTPVGPSANTSTETASSNTRRSDNLKNSSTSVPSSATTVPPAENTLSEQLPGGKPDEERSVGKSNQAVGVAPQAQTNVSTPRPAPPNPSIPTDADKSHSAGRPMIPLSFLRRPTPTQVRDMIAPRMPSGSVISEVAVQSRNEGSSSESEMSDASDSEFERTLSKKGKAVPRDSFGQGLTCSLALKPLVQATF